MLVTHVTEEEKGDVEIEKAALRLHLKLLKKVISFSCQIRAMTCPRHEG